MSAIDEEAAARPSPPGRHHRHRRAIAVIAVIVIVSIIWARRIPPNPNDLPISFLRRPSYPPISSDADDSTQWRTFGTRR